MKRNLLLGSVVIGVLAAAVSLTYAHSRHHHHRYHQVAHYILKPIDAWAYYRPEHHRGDVSHDAAHPSNIYKPYCNGGFDECAYDSIRNHSDGNPNR